jgi:hypothetical protein
LLQALTVLDGCFVAAAHATALFEHEAKAAPGACGLFKAECRVAELVLIGQGTQALQGTVAAGVQAIQMGRLRKVDNFGLHQFECTLIEAPSAQLAVAPQFVVVERLVLFDELGFQQQSAHVASGELKVKPLGLLQHAGFVCRAQV